MIKRRILPRLRDHLLKTEITLLTGPRQAGKTTLLRILEDDVKKQGYKYVYLNLDKETDFDLLDSQNSLLHYLKLELGTEKKSFVFIDEIQRKENAGRYLKGLYDMQLPYKFIISGSGSVELKEKVAESLAGRKKVFKLTTVDFYEYLNYVTEYKYENNLDDYLESEFFNSSYLKNYLRFGGYPKVVTSELLEDKISEMEEIFESYIDKDIKQLLDINKPKEYRDLVTLLAAQIGGLANYSDFSSRLNLSYETLQKYLYYLEKTFIISKVNSFHTNVGSEITKTPIYYFNDLGLRNYLVNQFYEFSDLIDGGELFENFVYLHLVNYKKPGSSVRFWRTKDGAEVDFIVKAGVEVTPIEVKYRKLEKNSLSRSFHSFVDKYEPKKGYIIHLGSNSLDRQVERTEISFLPYTWLNRLVY